MALQNNMNLNLMTRKNMHKLKYLSIAECVRTFTEA